MADFWRIAWQISGQRSSQASKRSLRATQALGEGDLTEVGDLLHHADRHDIASPGTGFGRQSPQADGVLVVDEERRIGVEKIGNHTLVAIHGDGRSSDLQIAVAITPRQQNGVALTTVNQEGLYKL